MQPIDYTNSVQSPFEAAISGYGLGSGIRAQQQQAQQRQQALDQNEAAAQQKQQQQVALDKLIGSERTAKDYEDATLAIPGMREQFKQGWDLHSAEEQKNSILEIGQVHAALVSGKPEIAIDMLTQKAEALTNSGADPKLVDAANNMAEVIKLHPDFARIQTGMQLASIPGGSEILDQLHKSQESIAKAGRVSVDQVQSAEILPDGTVQIVRKSGAVDIMPANKADKLLIKQAREFGAEIQGLRSGERAEAVNASKVSLKAFTKLGKIRKNIANLNRGIDILEKGAGTGPVEKMFPSFKAASVELDQLRSELGLDVVGGVTFGALSEGELKLALDVALPTGLNEPELKEWLTSKREAQRKLASNLSEAAIYLGTPGNNIAGFIESKKGDRVAEPGSSDIKATGDIQSLLDKYGNK